MSSILIYLRVMYSSKLLRLDLVIVVVVHHQMELVLEQLTFQEKAIPSVGMTVSQTEQLLSDLEALDARAEVSWPTEGASVHESHYGKHNLAMWQSSLGG